MRTHFANAKATGQNLLRRRPLARRARRACAQARRCDRRRAAHVAPLRRPHKPAPPAPGWRAGRRPWAARAACCQAHPPPAMPQALAMLFRLPCRQGGHHRAACIHLHVPQALTSPQPEDRTGGIYLTHSSLHAWLLPAALPHLQCERLTRSWSLTSRFALQGAQTSACMAG